MKNMQNCPNYVVHRGRQVLQAEEDAEEGGGGRHQEEEDGEDDGAEEELAHGVLRSVHPVSERVVFLTKEKSPERHQAAPLRDG